MDGPLINRAGAFLRRGRNTKVLFLCSLRKSQVRRRLSARQEESLRQMLNWPEQLILDS